MEYKKFFVRFKTDDEAVIRETVSSVGADIDFISEYDLSVAVVTVLDNNEINVLSRLRNHLLVESIFEDIQHQT